MHVHGRIEKLQFLRWNSIMARNGEGDLARGDGMCALAFHRESPVLLLRLARSDDRRWNYYRDKVGPLDQEHTAKECHFENVHCSLFSFCEYFVFESCVPLNPKPWMNQSHWSNATRKIWFLAVKLYSTHREGGDWNLPTFGPRSEQPVAATW